MVETAQLDDRLAAFEQTIAEQEDILYGIALFFEGVSLLFEGQQAVVETYRKQFRNIIQTGQTGIARARGLLNEARNDPARIPLVERFVFVPGQGHPEPDRLVERARMLVAAYEQTFPGRPRDADLNSQETLKLMDTAAAGYEVDA